MHPITEHALIRQMNRLGVPDALTPTVRKLLVAIQNGHTAVALDDPEWERWMQIPWIREASPSAPLHLSGPWLQSGRHAAQERRVAITLKSRLKPSASTAIDALNYMPHADASQQAAICQAVPQSLSLILGGPGTGKTSTAAAVVAAKLKQRAAPSAPKVALMAPTGKAAARLSEAFQSAVQAMSPEVRPDIALSATTVHRQLNQLGEMDLVLVDEASMLSLDLMDRLLKALSPSADLVMMGDPHQLASVEAGNILSTLASAPEFESARSILKGRHRTGGSGHLNALQDLCLAGDVAGFFQAIGDFNVPWLSPPHESALESMLLDRYHPYLQSVRDGSIPEQVEFQCLTSISSGIGGRHWINQRVAQQALGFGLEGRGTRYLVTENQPMLDIFNGDLAIALDATTDPNPRVQVTGSGRLIGLKQISRPELAYAISIHRAQGSEYPHVWVSLPTPPEGSGYRPTRELLYTALTRAKASVALWGSEAQLKTALETPTVRVSGLEYFLARD